jgi:hypothetical protein
MRKEFLLRETLVLCAFSIALALMLTILLNGSPAPRVAAAAPPAQGRVVVNAVDNDPDNRLWNCETNRVPFGNNETDRSRCFSFRYSVPREGIKSAIVYIALSTLGADQDTDATIVAVGKPYAPCAWGQGKMPGCVGLHGGFIGTHKSLNLNLLDIACDKSVQNTPEAQKLVLDQLQTGTLHMLLQDDTAVNSAQLVLNDTSATVPCGASATPVPTLSGSLAPTTSAQAQTATLSRFIVRTIAYATGGLDEDAANHVITGDRVTPSRPSDATFPPATRTFPLRCSYTWDTSGEFTYDGSITLALPERFATNGRVDVSATSSAQVRKNGFGVDTPVRLAVSVEGTNIQSDKTVQPFANGERSIPEVKATGFFTATSSLIQSPPLRTVAHDTKVEQRFNLQRLTLRPDEVAIAVTVSLANNDSMSTGILSCCGRVVVSTILAIYTVSGQSSQTPSPSDLPAAVVTAANTLLTGDSSPPPPNQGAVAAAAAAGVGALGAFAAVNSLLSRLATGGLTLPSGKTPEGLPSRTPLTKGARAGGAPSKPATLPEEQPPRSPAGTARAKPGNLPEARAEARPGRPAEGVAEARAGRPAEGVAEARAGRPAEGVAEARAGRPAEGVAEARAGRPAEGVAEARAGRPAEGVAEARAGQPAETVAEARAGRPAEDVAEVRAGRPAETVAEVRAGRPAEGVAEARPGRPAEAIAEARPGQPIEVEAKLREEAESKLEKGLDKLKDKIEGMAEPESEWKCTKCGKKNRVEHRFCVKCGTRRGQGG